MNWRTANKRAKRKESSDYSILVANWNEFPLGSVFQSCSLHPCITTKVTGWDIEGISVLDGRKGSCSIWSCGVYRMSEVEVEAYKNAWEKDGERGILTIYYKSEEAADAFIKQWRQ